MQFIHFEKINSTQDYALNIINNSNIQEDILITANVQTEGRGRLKQRKWCSEYGNFHGSFIINIEKLGISINNVSILNSLIMRSIFEFLNSILENNLIKIKLPNDIYYNNKKLAGVLIEVVYPFAIIGIGINIYTAPLDISISLYNIIQINNIYLSNINNIFDSNYGLSEKYCNKLYKIIIQNILNK